MHDGRRQGGREGGRGGYGSKEGELTFKLRLGLSGASL